MFQDQYTTPASVLIEADSTDTGLVTEKTSNPYDFSRPLDVLLFSKFKVFKKAIDSIIQEIRPDLGKAFEQNQKDYKSMTKLVVLNLFEAWNEHEDLYVGFSRNQNAYGPGTRNHRLHVKYRPLIKSIDALEQAGYLKQKNGFQDPNTGIGRQSRMIATDKLITTLISYKIEWQMVQRGKDDPIVLRDADKNDIEFKAPRSIQTKSANVNRLNKYLTQQDISFEAPKTVIKSMWARKIKQPNMKRDQLTRVFNESWDEGGRFYRGWWQGLPSEYRQHIRINGKPVTELDFSSIHPYILYARKGLPMPEGDMYTVEDMLAKQRKICKTILLTIFNVRPDQNPLKAVMYDLNRKEGIRLGSKEVEHLIGQLKAKHEPIAEYFGSGVGRQLQKTDSNIAERVMLRLMEQDIPCLPVHDSFIVPVQHEDALRQATIEAAKALTGQTPRVDKKY